MGAVSTATLGGSQIGNALQSGGQSSQDLSEGANKSSNLITSDSQYNIAQGAQFNALALHSGDQSPIAVTFNQESPAAIAALGAVATNALWAASNASEAVAGYSAKVASNALDAASKGTSPGVAIMQTLGLAAVAIAILWFLAKRKG